MPSKRDIVRSVTGHPDIGLWHLGAGLLLAGGALVATIGLPSTPWSVVVALRRSLEAARAAAAGLPRLVGTLSSGATSDSSTASNLPTMVDLELFFRSPSTSQLDTVAIVLSWIAWLLWLWLLGTTVLRIIVVVGDRTAAGARWPARLGAISDRITLSLVRQAVDATLAGEMLLRAVAPGSAPVPALRVDYALVRSTAIGEPLSASYAAAVHDFTMAPDLQPGDVLYTVQSGDSLSAIAGRFYGDPAAFKRIVEANLGREQPGGQTLRDARFIYPGWQIVIPAPTQTIYTDAAGQRWYTVRDGDTLSGISARLLGDAERYTELFADNDGAELGDGHVLTNPNLIWPGLHLRLPVEPTPDQAAEPAPPLSLAPPADTSRPASAMPVASSPETNGQAASTDDANGNGADNSGFVNVEPAPTVVPPTDEMPVRPAPGQQSPGFWPALWLPGDARADLGIAAGLSAAALLALSARRRRRTPPEPESDTRLDVHGFTLAEPTAVVASRLAGTGDDPHGIVLGELLAGELLRHARVAELADVGVISVIGGRTGSVVTLSTSLEDRPLLEAALRTETQLARRIEISRSAEQEIVVRLRGVHREALARMSLQDCPVLLCLGMLPDSRSYLVGWQALGHVLAATQPGTTDAEEHLAALVATLAGQLPPSELQLFTVARENTWLRQLAPLPHQGAVIDPGNTDAVAKMLADLRTELEQRQRASDVAMNVQLVLVVSELGEIHAHDDLAYLLSNGSEYEVRVMAATADSAVERGPLVDMFDSHVVFGLQDEEASARLLGTPWALTLAEPGRLLVRLGRRKEVEVLGLHLTEDGRRDLLASMGIIETAPAPGQVVDAAVDQGENDAPQDMVGDGTRNAAVLPDPAKRDDDLREPGTHAGSGSAPESSPAAAAMTSARPDTAEHPGRALEGPVLAQPASRPAETQSRPMAAAEVDIPGRITHLLARAPLVVDCEEASVWSADGRLGIGQSSPVEVLLYLASAPLQDQGRLADWVGVQPETLLAEVWAPRARFPDNRDSGQTWLGKNLGRLQDEVHRAAGGVRAEVVVKRRGALRLNEEVVISDVEAFMAAVERARTAHGAEQIGAAEEALRMRVTGLLSRVVRKPRTAGPKVELYRWLGEAHWERAARRLEALGREAAMLLARAYRDTGRHDEALALYDQLLGEDPLDRRACEGLLIAAAGTRDVVRLEQAWQQVCAYLAGDGDADARSLYEQLRRDVNGAGPWVLRGRSAVAVAVGDHHAQSINGESG